MRFLKKWQKISIGIISHIGINSQCLWTNLLFLKLVSLYFSCLLFVVGLFHALAEVLVELNLFIAQAFNLIIVELGSFEVLPDEVMLDNLPLLSQLHAFFKAIGELGIFLIKLGLSLGRQVCPTRFDTKTLVSDIKIGKELFDSLLTELISQGVAKALLSQSTLLACQLLCLEVLLDLGGGLDFTGAAIALGFLLFS